MVEALSRKREDCQMKDENDYWVFNRAHNDDVPELDMLMFIVIDAAMSKALRHANFRSLFRVFRRDCDSAPDQQYTITPRLLATMVAAQIDRMPKDVAEWTDELDDGVAETYEELYAAKIAADKAFLRHVTCVSGKQRVRLISNLENGK